VERGQPGEGEWMWSWSGERVATARRVTIGRPRRPIVALEVVALVVGLAIVYRLDTHTWRLPEADVQEYYQYARMFWLGHPAFHALPAEYPPLAILPFSLTLLPATSSPSAVFAVWMGAFVVLGYVGMRVFVSRPRALAYAAYLLLGTTATLISRYDIVPALVTLAALFAARRRRYTLAYALIAVGVLLKLYPVVVLPVVMIAQWRDVASVQTPMDGGEAQPARARMVEFARRPATALAARGAALCLGSVTLVYAMAWALSPSGALAAFRYASARPIQLESAPATLMWLGSFAGFPARPDSSFLSHNVVGPLDGPLKALSIAALCGGCLWVYWRQARGRLPMERAFLAALLVVVATNKLLSAQYFIWLLPVAAAVEGWDALWLGLCLLSTYEFPIVYHRSLLPLLWSTGAYEWKYLLLVAVRNGLLIVVTLRAILRGRTWRIAKPTIGEDGRRPLAVMARLAGVGARMDE
ncbi:MAG TPA: glycosyltransferase 87 family protein, partial [Ktedonobacterales bacterium]|nr:glycosyltransferase 87 family protein [Ktedonobacterales bacterium]